MDRQHVNIGIVFSFYWKFPMVLIEHSVISDWLFNTQSRVQQADWFILDINEKATLNIKMPWLFINNTCEQPFLISASTNTSFGIKNRC